MGALMRVYVVTNPPSIQGIYDTWAACKAAVAGVPGARYQAVSSRETAEAMLRGDGLALGPGWYAFVDGNHLGGVGVVLVGPETGGERTVKEISASVAEVLRDAGIPSLSSESAIADALDRLRNVLAELTALLLALREAPAGIALTVVHDYEGVGAWMEGRWKTKDPIVAEVVAACRALAATRGLSVTFRRQPGHQSTWAGRDDFARYNGRADRLATAAAQRGGR
jgi:ribonuclease H-related protein